MLHKLWRLAFELLKAYRHAVLAQGYLALLGLGLDLHSIPPPPECSKFKGPITSVFYKPPPDRFFTHTVGLRGGMKYVESIFKSRQAKKD